MTKLITLNHGSGGRQMQSLIKDLILKHLGNESLNRLDDSAPLDIPGKRIAMTTDSYVVDPLFFPGGDIGRLCVCGTVNDLATSGARPMYLTLAFILEEGLDLEILEKIILSIASTAKEAGVCIVTGDTKVVEKGKGDKIYINTSGVGVIDEGISISSHNALTGDDVIVTGPIGNHEASLMIARNLLPVDAHIESDVAPLNKFVEAILKKTKAIHTIKDPTRSGLAGALNEISEHSNCTITLEEKLIPVDREVQSLCDLAGFDPLYLANEGKYVIVCDRTATKDVLEVFKQAKVIGTVSKEKNPSVVIRTLAAGLRRLGPLETTQLPRIC